MSSWWGLLTKRRRNGYGYPYRSKVEVGMKYNTPCPGHNHHCWTHRHLMREDDIVCTTCYKRLPDEFKRMSWQLKLSDMHPTTAKSKLSIIVDWLLEHPLQDDVDCYKAQEERADKRLKEESLGLTDSWVD